MTDLSKLRAPFPPEKVSWRVGATNKEKTRGMALAYIDARDVMERLDEVCGPKNWQDRYEIHGNTAICYLSIRVNDEWITKADGAGDTDVEAEKGRISDAFKRAAVRWGIGRYLYELPSTWVELEKNSIKESEMEKLRALLSPKPKAKPKTTQDQPVEGPSQNGTGKQDQTDPEYEFLSSIYGELQALKNRDAAVEWWKSRHPLLKERKVPDNEIEMITQSLAKRFPAPKEAA